VGLKEAWENLTCADKLALFNLWNVVSTVGNVCAIAYTSVSVTTLVDVVADAPLRLLIGLSCLMLWLSLVQYLEFSPRYYVMILTLKRAVPRIGRFLVGILPCFVGYALLGLILFGDQNELFGSMFDTVGTLFAVVNGDSILDVVGSVSYVPVLGELYICVYIMLFMYVCLMTCIAIVEESFFSSAEHAHTLWLGAEGLAYGTGYLDDQDAEVGRRKERGSVLSPQLSPRAGQPAASRRPSGRVMPAGLRNFIRTASQDVVSTGVQAPSPPFATSPSPSDAVLSRAGSYNLREGFSMGVGGGGGFTIAQLSPRASIDEKPPLTEAEVDDALTELQANLLTQLTGPAIDEDERRHIIRAIEATRSKVGSKRTRRRSLTPGR
jgi:hypothetical protein